jgi:hypothetical protein
MLTSAPDISRRIHRSARETEPGWAPFFCMRGVRAHIRKMLQRSRDAYAGNPSNAADALKSQCYTARTIHVAYPQQAGRRQAGSLE